MYEWSNGNNDPYTTTKTGNHQRKILVTKIQHTSIPADSPPVYRKEPLPAPPAYGKPNRSCSIINKVS